MKNTVVRLMVVLVVSTVMFMVMKFRQEVVAFAEDVLTTSEQYETAMPEPTHEPTTTPARRPKDGSAHSSEPKHKLEPEPTPTPRPARRLKDGSARSSEPKHKLEHERTIGLREADLMVNPIHTAEEAVAYVQNRVEWCLKTNHLHFYSRIEGDDKGGEHLEVFIPELGATFSRPLNAEGKIPQIELCGMISSVVSYWYEEPLDLYPALEYVQQRMDGTGVEDVYGVVSDSEDGQHFFNLACKREEGVDFKAVECEKHCKTTTYEILEKFCQEYEAELAELYEELDLD